jgi:4-amino-4-deoxy-L-arabinose transferase-like glycosyltransferase
MASVTREGSRNALRALVLVVGVALCTSVFTVFVGWRAQHLVTEGSDPYGYVAMARGLLRGEGFSQYGSVLNRRGPLYPAFIALVYLIVGERPVVMQLIQVAMMAAVCGLTFDIGRRLYNLRTGLIAGLVCALNPVLLRYVADFHVETFLVFLCTMALWRSVLLVEAPSAKNGALFGVAAALGALAKPVVLAYPVVFVAWWLFVGWRARRRDDVPSGTKPPVSARRPPLLRQLPAQWTAAASVFLAMAVVILPWTYRNYRSSGHPVLITTGFGDAFLRGYIFSKTEYATLKLPPYTYAENESNASFRALCKAAGTEWERNDIESEQILTQESKRKLLADPALFVRKFVVQLFTFWYEMTSLVNSLVAGALAIVLWAFALVGLRRARELGRPAWPLLLPVLTLNLSLAVLLALGRYSVPVLPALTVLAALGVDALLEPRRTTSKEAEVT